MRVGSRVPTTRAASTAVEASYNPTLLESTRRRIVVKNMPILSAPKPVLKEIGSMSNITLW
eukprot:scaffold254004_cov29-Tisochrysis_lutea.AAC.1